jgi:hypothetical protein
VRQDPAEELLQLRAGDGKKRAELKVGSNKSVPLDGPGGEALDIRLRLHRGGSIASGILLRAWLKTSQEGVPCAEALVINWEEAELQVPHHLAPPPPSVNLTSTSFIAPISLVPAVVPAV